MTKETKITDPYASIVGKHKYSKIQILTVDQLLNCKRSNIPSTTSVYQEGPLAKGRPNHQKRFYSYNYLSNVQLLYTSICPTKEYNEPLSPMSISITSNYDFCTDRELAGGIVNDTAVTKMFLELLRY